MADQPDLPADHALTTRLSALQSDCIAISVLIDSRFGSDSQPAKQADRVLKALSHLRATLQAQESAATPALDDA